ncbi:hypothetical protein [Intestinimonas butyriciproducens]|jgi:hypothetical protein|uniref:hypothetical protein n=1 Tax=Intestinimonas butyriciproducens TaxID=1297617 RepID=UPI00189E2D35|nr:hypothetical protein [Intestinimonas butyriciproducens]MBO3279228.1 hypothetical protein [Intestinimonas butyriciproducens]MBS6524308.1 hypothetical protein [Clostridiales bacterium]MCB7051008.1 hypothetical protein [Intestinimonas butyriciproducens]
MKRFWKEFRALSHEPITLMIVWLLVVGTLFCAVFFSLVGFMSPYDGMMWGCFLLCLLWAVWASFPPKDE